jgi:excisionase family DNA binding protein
MIGTITETQDQTIALSVENASKLSSLSKPFLRLEIQRGKLRVVRPGGSRRVLIMMSDFMNYLQGENENEK